MFSLRKPFKSLQLMYLFFLVWFRSCIRCLKLLFIFKFWCKNLCELRRIECSCTKLRKTIFVLSTDITLLLSSVFKSALMVLAILANDEQDSCRAVLSLFTLISVDWKWLMMACPQTSLRSTHLTSAFIVQNLQILFGSRLYFVRSLTCSSGEAEIVVDVKAFFNSLLRATYEHWRSFPSGNWN